MIAIALLLAQAAEMPFTCDPPRGQSEQTRCGNEDYRAADRELNAQWRKTLAHQRMLDKANLTDSDGLPTYVDGLTRSQRAWIAFRDAQCRWEGLGLRGSGGPQLEAECLARMTRERTTYLQTLGDE
jgi:uncharacterized protein YecT (DUF1311 family)